MSYLSLTVTLFILLDSFGNIPLFLSVLKKVDHNRYFAIILREMFIALGVLVFFLFTGDKIFDHLKIDQHSITISGGIILFMIAVRMIFSPIEMEDEDTPKKKVVEPFIVPLAIPLVAGPAVIASVMVYSQTQPNIWITLAALVTAWAASTVLLLGSLFFKKILGHRGLAACEKLMGLVLTIFSVQMLLTGLKHYISTCNCH